MKKYYKHLSVEERNHLSVLKGKGLSLRAISLVLKRSPSTLSRELKRNVPPIRSGYYLSHRAHQRYVLRNHQRARRLRLKTKRIRAYVRRQLKRGWSPELISGRLGHLRPKQTIGPEAIYQWVYAEATDLISCLVRHHRKRLSFGHTHRQAQNHQPTQAVRPLGNRHHGLSSKQGSDASSCRTSKPFFQVGKAQTKDSSPNESQPQSHFRPLPSSGPPESDI